MAEETSSEDRSEEATPRRLEQAREEGMVPRSRELSTSGLLLAGAGAAMLLGEQAARRIGEFAQHMLSVRTDWLRFDESLVEALKDAAVAGVLAALPTLALLAVVGALTSVGLGGFNFSASSLGFKASRMNPLSGLKRMVGVAAWVELGKALLKFIAVGVPIVWLLYGMSGELLRLADQDVRGAIAHALQLAGKGFLGMAAATALVALIDVPYQLFDYGRKLRMSREEVKEELKNTEGRPEVKARIRRVAQELSRRRMMSDVPKADVIITNPEHYAIALKYDANNMAAPRVLAKGVDLVAQQIRWVASGARVAEVRAPALARALYYSTDIGGEIPSGLYVAVAQVLAYVFQLARYQQGYAARPTLNEDLPIPDDLRRD